MLDINSGQLYDACSWKWEQFTRLLTMPNREAFLQFSPEELRQNWYRKWSTHSPHPKKAPVTESQRGNKSHSLYELWLETVLSNCGPLSLLSVPDESDSAHHQAIDPEPGKKYRSGAQRGKIAESVRSSGYDCGALSRLIRSRSQTAVGRPKVCPRPLFQICPIENWKERIAEGNNGVKTSKNAIFPWWICLFA